MISDSLKQKLDSDEQRQIKKEKDEVRRVKAKLKREKSTAQLVHFIDRYKNTAMILKKFLSQVEQPTRRRQLEDLEEIIRFAETCLVKLQTLR
jgi:hypothetical protein